MTRRLTISFSAMLLMGLATLLAACGSVQQSRIPPTPAGVPLGQPTFVYLWTFP